ncbi:MAG: hypothetical protein ABJP79_08670 [Tateyamaria sp.]|uniref:hypothetical protein n=1 Tax=Tateyamaria sp. TaxID=1929288 RepID=UPI00329BA21D
MRVILAFIFVVFALPAVAQQEQECRGKQAFNLGDGAYGCLEEVGTSSITTTQTRDDAASEQIRSNQVGLIRVLMFGTHGSSRQVVGSRLRTICQTFLPTFNAQATGRKFSRITVAMVWPRVANKGDFVPVTTSQVDVQVAFSNGKCRGIRFFG